MTRFNFFIIALMLLFCNLNLLAQNLVTNPSFENYGELECGILANATQFSNYIDDWKYATGGTSDAFNNYVENSCYTSTFSTHYYSEGTQLPRTGEIMGGIYLYNNTFTGCGNPTCFDGYREYLQVKLLEPLEIGKTYAVEFWASLGDSMIFASNNLGMYFSDTIISEFAIDGIVNKGSLPFTPQINETTIITETSEWVSIKGCFIAESAAEYIIIGNFYDNDETESIVVRPFDETSPTIDYKRHSYYYIDDVSVELMPFSPTITDEDGVLTTELALTYQWYLDDEIIDGANEQTYTYIEDGFYKVIVSDSSGCMYQSDVYIIGDIDVHGISENIISEFWIHPNPAQNEITVDLLFGTLQEANLVISDLAGKEITYYNLGVGKQMSTTINVESIPNGIYFVSLVIDGEQSQIKRLVKI